MWDYSFARTVAGHTVKDGWLGLLQCKLSDCSSVFLPTLLYFEKLTAVYTCTTIFQAPFWSILCVMYGQVHMFMCVYILCSGVCNCQGRTTSIFLCHYQPYSLNTGPHVNLSLDILVTLVNQHVPQDPLSTSQTTTGLKCDVVLSLSIGVWGQ